MISYTKMDQEWGQVTQVWQWEGKIGVRFTYTLMKDEKSLDRPKSLATQGVATDLWFG